MLLPKANAEDENKDIQFGELYAELNISSLHKGEIHLWGNSLQDTAALLERCKAALTDKEREQMFYYAFPQVQDDFALSRGGLRLLLSSYLNREPKKIRIERYANGKPYTPDDASLCFNVSHTGSHCAYAFSCAVEVGIDIEEVRPLFDMEDLIDKNFTEKEKAYINKNVKIRSRRFFQLWTMKEAYLKAIGEGMRIRPDKLEFSIENEKFRLESVNGIAVQDDWIFKELATDGSYIGAIAYKNVSTKVMEMRFI